MVYSGCGTQADSASVWVPSEFRCFFLIRQSTRVTNPWDPWNPCAKKTQFIFRLNSADNLTLTDLTDFFRMMFLVHSHQAKARSFTIFGI